MDLIVIVLAIILNPIARRRRKRAAIAAMEAETVPAESDAANAEGGDEVGITERGEPVSIGSEDGIDEKRQRTVNDDGEKGDSTVTTNDARR